LVFLLASSSTLAAAELTGGGRLVGEPQPEEGRDEAQVMIDDHIHGYKLACHVERDEVDYSEEGVKKTEEEANNIIW